MGTPARGIWGSPSIASIQCNGAIVVTPRFAAKTLFFSFAICIPGLASPQPASKAVVVISPDGKLTAELSVTDGVLSYRVTAYGKQILAPSKLGIQSDDVELGQGVTLGAARMHKINEQYRFFG